MEETLNRLHELYLTRSEWSRDLGIEVPLGRVFEGTRKLVKSVGSPEAGTLRIFPSEEGGLEIHRRLGRHVYVVTVTLNSLSITQYAVSVLEVPVEFGGVSERAAVTALLTGSFVVNREENS